MRSVLRSTALAAIVLVSPALALAAPGLRAVMHEWRTEARTIDGMLAGRAPPDQAAIRAALTAYIDDATSIEARLNSRTADARDFKARMAAFGGDAQTALRHVDQQAALKADFTKIVSDCRSCHDQYKN